tara:strand:- start:4313 stop:6361 length:2049 start_codon:yes stop_codon:yes gene_type:complete
MSLGGYVLLIFVSSAIGGPIALGYAERPASLEGVTYLLVGSIGASVASCTLVRFLGQARHRLVGGKSPPEIGYLETGVSWPVIDPWTLPVPETLKGIDLQAARMMDYITPERLELVPEPLQHAYGVAVEARDRSADLEKRKFINFFIYSLAGLELEDARKMLRTGVMAVLSLEERQRLEEGSYGVWASLQELHQSGRIFRLDKSYVGALDLGIIKGEDDYPYTVQLTGEGHLMMIAPPGAGKNQNYILPNLANYDGPVICLDPKGENYDQTAWMRHQYGDVYRFAPWSDDTDCFNPLDFVESWTDARALTSLLVVPDRSGNPFWNEAATNLITGLIWYLKRGAPREQQTLRQVVRLLSTDDYAALVESLETVDDDNLKDAANGLLRQASDGGSSGPLGSIFLTAKTHMEIWSSPEITDATSRTTPGFDPVNMLRRCRQREDEKEKNDRLSVGRDMKEYVGDEGYSHFERGVLDTVFVIIPPDKIREYAAVLRVLLGWTLKKVIDFAGKQPDDRSIERRPFLFIFDELPQLGYMEVIERSAPIVRSYNIRLWMVTQSLAQLQQVYPQWQTIMNGCAAEVFFSPNDSATAQYISARLGTRDDMWGGRREIAPVSELLGGKYNGRAIIFFRDHKPALVELPRPFYKKGEVIEHFDAFKREWTGKLNEARAERAQSRAKATSLTGT